MQIRLKELDLQGSQDSRRHCLKQRVYNVPGPNFCWNVDGYDKIKPYGFPLHGAIDGYSRRLFSQGAGLPKYKFRSTQTTEKV